MHILKLIKNISLLLLLAATMMSFVNSDREISGQKDPPTKLSAGTSVLLNSTREYSSDSLVFGQLIDFKVIVDIKVGAKVVIPAGAKAQGEVISLKKAKILGKPGELRIMMKTVEAINGQKIPITAPIIIKEGNDLTTLTIILSILVSLFFLLLMGTNAKLPKGTIVESKIEKDIEIDTN